MKYYLSSFKIGDYEKKLVEMTENGNKNVTFISNALDFATDLVRRSKSDKLDIADLKRLGFNVNILDLKKYINKSNELEETLEQYDVIWVRGGNVFVLAQPMMLSGFKDIILKYHKKNREIVYGGYSAGICILGPTLLGLHLVDDPNQKPYGEQYQTIWDGLNITDYVIVPHYKSDHPESEDINKVVEFLHNSRVPYKTLQDGEVIIIE